MAEIRAQTTQHLGIAQPHSDQHHQRQVDPRNHSGQGRTTNPHSRSTPVAVNQQPVAKQVHQVRCDQPKGDRANIMNTLQISAKRRIDKQRRQTPQQDPIELQCALQDLGPHADHT